MADKKQTIRQVAQLAGFERYTVSDDDGNDVAFDTPVDMVIHASSTYAAVKCGESRVWIQLLAVLR